MYNTTTKTSITRITGEGNFESAASAVEWNELGAGIAHSWDILQEIAVARKWNVSTVCGLGISHIARDGTDQIRCRGHGKVVVWPQSF